MVRIQLLMGWLAATASVVTVSAQEPPAAIDSFQQRVRPLLARYCYECHGGDKPKAGLSLASFSDESAVLSQRATWRRESIECGNASQFSLIRLRSCESKLGVAYRAPEDSRRQA